MVGRVSWAQPASRPVNSPVPHLPCWLRQRGAQGEAGVTDRADPGEAEAQPLGRGGLWTGWGAVPLAAA